ncbi:hypothetical protein RBI14_15410 [Alcaligenaceae bacterium B3P038]|nr:hypothetical protein [Alcaligenaceae bacterium B3P038]
MTAGQSKRSSAVEAVVNVAIGLMVSMAANAVVFPLYGFQPSLADNVGITLIYTAISLVCSYYLRRAFNWFGFGRQARKPS